MNTSYAVDIEQLLEDGHVIRIKPEGYSMYPFFVPGRDAAIIEKVSTDTLKRGMLLYIVVRGAFLSCIGSAG